MFRVVMATLVAVFLYLPSAVAACADMDIILSQLSMHKAPLHQFTDQELPEVIAELEGMGIGNLSGATRAFIFATSAGVQVGVEVEGCTLDPIMIAPPKHKRLSGKSADGRIGA